MAFRDDPLLRRFLGSAFLAAFSIPAFAADNAKDDQQSLEDVLNLKVTVATKRETSLRETPGIVSVITYEQMKNAGARDLMDVINRLVPAFTFASDMEVGAGLMVRGIWGSEGKVLVLVDGQDMNEEKFGTNQFIKHFPIDNIARVEIIRGPGSSIYGGYAALAVISITTKGPSMNGGYASVMSDLAQGGTSLERRASVGYGKKIGDLSVAANAWVSRGLISDRTVDMYMTKNIDMASADVNAANVNVLTAYKDTSLRFIVDRYRTPTLYFDYPADYPWNQIEERYDSVHLELKHDVKLTKSITITPNIFYKKEWPYYTDFRKDEVDGLDPSALKAASYNYRNTTEKKGGGFNLNVDFTDKTNLTAGYQGYVNAIYRPKDAIPVVDEVFNGDPDNDHMAYRDDAVYLQLMNYNDILNITVGARYDKTDAFGSNFAPRVGFTKVIGKFHGKYMLAQSFRVPGGILQNDARRAPGIDRVNPERAVSNELEAGYQLTKSLWVSLNLFDIKMRDTIFYDTAPEDPTSGYYANGGFIRARGAESEIKLLTDSLDTTLTYAYTTIVDDEIRTFTNPANSHAPIGAPQHRGGLVMAYKVTRQYSVLPSVTVLGKTYANKSYIEETQEPEFAEYKPIGIANLGVRGKDVMFQGFELDLTCHNLTNADYWIPQGYRALYPAAPLPGMSRSFAAQATYRF